jgi:hypothetical protein
MVQIKFAPISTEKQIPGTNVQIQIGIIQDNEQRSWGVKLTQKGKVIAAKRIKKLIDVEITGIIRDTIGKLVALDTFELGGMLGGILREVYDKIKEKHKPADTQAAAAEPAPASRPQPAEPAPASRPQPAEPQAAPQQADLGIPDIKLPATSGSSDSFWSAYSSYDGASVPAREPAPEQPYQELPSEDSSAPAQQTPISNGLDAAMSILGSKCPNCGKDVGSDLDKCPYCGQSL